MTVPLDGGSLTQERMTDLPLMLGTEIVSMITSGDGGGQIENLCAVNPHPLGMNARWLDGQFTKAGWALVEDSQGEDGVARVLVFQRGREWCEVRLMREVVVGESRTTLLYTCTRG